jgi:hypothetical protein
VALQNVVQIDIEGIAIAGRTDSALPWLSVQTARVLRMRGCTVAAAPRASALFQGITGTCDISHCVFGGDVAFYGMPPTTFPVTRLRTVLANGDFEVPAGQGLLTFAHNQLPKLALGEETLKQLTERRFEGLFHSVALSGNQFSESPVLCAGVLLSCAGNHFAIDRPADGNTYGVLVSRVAAASANVGDRFGDNATVHFLTTKGQFKGAANMVFTLPQSTP